MKDSLYSELVEYLINRVMFDIMNEETDGVTSYRTDNHDEEILVTLTIAGGKRTISIPVLEVIGPDNASQFLEQLVQEVAPTIRNKIHALKIKLKGR
ncbi:hypothetical protein CMI37_05215 [Candidatus Pacearchaeota archaeon]|nr:hypothetical protein [Candidatus Pacearchaeota archaeon]|tara:strand:- start:170 stop:460 length:291 start_codon:yes stop_codon:yes gene_type:complete